jgi:nitrogen fixation/metabolism regulation signal transduction histidine kinase
MGIIIQGLKHLSKQKEFDYNLLKEIEEEIVSKISYMSQTIDDFSTFFRISKQKEFFNVLTSVKDSIRLIDVQLNENNIKTIINRQDDLNLEFFGFANEFRQVILNMIHNTMMAITETKQKNGYVNISILSKNNKLIIELMDNGGGVKDENLEKIFDPYFTTKPNGSGIGLYMSKIIIEHHMQGSLTAQNFNDGVKFVIELQQ